MSAIDIEALLTGRDADADGGDDDEENKRAAERANARLIAASKKADALNPTARKKKGKDDGQHFLPLTFANVQVCGGCGVKWGGVKLCVQYAMCLGVYVSIVFSNEN